MGSRGIGSGAGNPQITLKNVAEQNSIAEIISKSAERRKMLLEGDDGGGIGAELSKKSPRLLKKCACCGEYALPATSIYEICSNCGWIDDKFQNANPNSLNGKNPITLNEARALYLNKRQ